MAKIYCISGLAADHRLFQNIALPGFELIPVPWVTPDPTDDLISYAAKMAAQIKEANPIIIGLSMGGMIASEIGKIVSCKKIILISSAKTSREVNKRPFVLDFIGRKGLAPAGLLNIPFPMVLNSLGAFTNDEKQLLRAVIRDSDTGFMKWAIKAILEWKSTESIPGIYHLHGTADRVLAPACVHPDVWIKGGTHIMILNRAAEINKQIAEQLAQC